MDNNLKEETSIQDTTIKGAQTMVGENTNYPEIKRRLDGLENRERNLLISTISIFGIFASIITFLVVTIVKSSTTSNNWLILLIGSGVSLSVSIILFISCISKLNNKKRELRKFWKFFSNIFFKDRK